MLDYNAGGLADTESESGALSSFDNVKENVGFLDHEEF